MLEEDLTEVMVNEEGEEAMERRCGGGGRGEKKGCGGEGGGEEGCGTERREASISSTPSSKWFNMGKNTCGGGRRGRGREGTIVAAAQANTIVNVSTMMTQ